MPLQPMITAARHMISAGHYLATQAGHAVLEAGGNAVDAGVAAGIALGVVHSDQVQCSGVAPMIIYLAERDEAVVISGLGGWPRAARLEALPRRARRRDPAGHPPHGGAGGAGRVDPRARALRHHELRRRRGRRHPLCARGLHHASGDGPLHREERRDLSPLAGQCRHLPAPGPAAPRGRAVRPGGSRPLAAVHGGRGARGEPRRTDRRASRGARCLLSRRPGGGHGALPRRARRLAHRARPGGLPFRDRAPALDHASAASRCSPAARGARGRSCSRCCPCSPPTISPRSATIRRPTSISSPRS